MFGLASTSAFAQEAEATHTIQFFHEDYPPYVYVESGAVTGEIARITVSILKKAGLRVSWRQTNYSRLIRELAYGANVVCAAGYSGLHQKQFDVLASAAIGWFPGAALVVKQENLPLFQDHQSIEDVLRDTRLRGAFLNDVNYMGITKELFALGSDRHIKIGGSDRELGLLVARGRVHFAPINAAQTSYLRNTLSSAEGLVSFQPTGMRPPREVGIICSRHMPVDIWRRINEAIEPLAPYPGRTGQ